jgi:hypothetical protein
MSHLDWQQKDMQKLKRKMLFNRSYSNTDLKSGGELQKSLRRIKSNQSISLWGSKPGKVCGLVAGDSTFPNLLPTICLWDTT